MSTGHIIWSFRTSCLVHQLMEPFNDSLLVHKTDQVCRLWWAFLSISKRKWPSPFASAVDIQPLKPRNVKWSLDESRQQENDCHELKETDQKGLSRRLRSMWTNLELESKPAEYVKLIWFSYIIPHPATIGLLRLGPKQESGWWPQLRIKTRVTAWLSSMIMEQAWPKWGDSKRPHTHWEKRHLIQ